MLLYFYTRESNIKYYVYKLYFTLPDTDVGTCDVGHIKVPYKNTYNNPYTVIEHFIMKF